MTATTANTYAGKNKLLWLIGFAGLFAVFSPALYHLYGAWFFDPYYAHGFVVPLVSLYLAWMSRDRLSDADQSARRHPIRPLAAFMLIYAASFIMDFRFLMYVSFVLALGGLVLFVWGAEMLKRLRFPLAYLLLMIPLPYALTSAVAFPLQLASSGYAALLLDLAGVSALQEGVNIHIPGFSFVIEKGCSGLNSIIALFTLAVLFAYLVDGPLRKKVFLVFSALPIALMANLTRIVVVILVARTWGKEAAESFFHWFSSVFLFSLAFLLLLATARIIGCLQIKK